MRKTAGDPRRAYGDAGVDARIGRVDRGMTSEAIGADLGDRTGPGD